MFCRSCAALLIVLALAVPTPGQVGQAVPLEHAPELSGKPWLLVFLPANAASDPVSRRLLAMLGPNRELGAELRQACRFHELEFDHKRTADYAKFHEWHLPAVILAAPEVHRREDIWCITRREGVALAAEDPDTLREELFAGRDGPTAEDLLLPVSAETNVVGEDDKKVGRPGLLPWVWNDPPYRCRPRLNRLGVNLDWDGSSRWYGSGCRTPCAVTRTPCPCRPTPSYTNPPPPPSWQPPPYGYAPGYSQTAYQDTVLARRYREMLKERIAERAGKATGNFLGGLVGGAADNAGVIIGVLAVVAVLALVGGLIAVRLYSNAMDAGRQEDDD